MLSIQGVYSVGSNASMKLESNFIELLQELRLVKYPAKQKGQGTSEKQHTWHNILAGCFCPDSKIVYA